MLSTASRPLEVLFVEDDDDHAELVVRSLEEHGIGNRLTRLKPANVDLVAKMLRALAAPDRPRETAAG